MSSKITKNIKKFVMILSITMLATCLVQVFCTTSASAAVKLNKTKVTLCKGQTYQLKVTGTKSKAKWTSSNKKNVSVSSTGKIKALKASSVSITATVGKKKYYCTVKVEDPKFQKAKYSTNPGEKYTLQFGKTTQKITWKTSNKNIVAISGAKYNKFNCYGTITATIKGTGTATVTATVGNKTFKCTFSSTATGKAAIKIVKKYISKYGMAFEVKNGNNYTAAFGIKVYLLDSKKKSIGYVEASTPCLGAKKSAVLPICTNYRTKKLCEYNYASTKIEIFNFQKTTLKDMSSYVTVSKAGFDTAKDMTSYPKINLTTSKDLNGGIAATILFFDKNNKFVCASMCSSSNSCKAGTTQSVSITSGTAPNKVGIYEGAAKTNITFDSSKTQVCLHCAYTK